MKFKKMNNTEKPQEKKSLLSFLLNGERFKKFISKLVPIFKLFILLNFFLFSIVLIKNIPGKPYPLARSCMYSAATINNVYIYPLSILGWENPLTWPFYLIRDGLYNAGMVLFPKNEGEKEIWWQNIRWNEFIHVVYNDMLNYCQSGQKRFPWQVYQYQNWVDEIYNHIEPFSSAKISDPVIRKEKLQRFIDIAQTSVDSSYSLFGHQEELRGRDLPIYFDKAHADKFEKVYYLYENFKDYSQKHEKDSYEYFVKNVRYEDIFLKHSLTRQIIASRLISDKLTCNDPLLKVFADTHQELVDYYEKYKQDLGYGESIKLQLLYDTGVVTKGGKSGLDDTHRQCSVLKNYDTYFDKKAEELGMIKVGGKYVRKP